mmetsp:Transcript_2466/g.3837  ORF Transcript_2466/g.3837 Transcript_2466/m.3837 type:complete len:294 (+) Transcript_2466:153-1034(+)
MNGLYCLGSMRREARSGLDNNDPVSAVAMWEDIGESWSQAGSNQEWNILHFTDNEHIGNCGVDPSSFVVHTGDKLKAIWRDMVREFRLALNWQRRSGNHARDFFGGCYGRVYVLYMKLSLDQIPNLLDFVDSDLGEAFFESERSADVSNKAVSSPARNGGGSAKTTPSAKASMAIADAVRGSNEVFEKKLEYKKEQETSKAAVEKEKLLVYKNDLLWKQQQAERAEEREQQKLQASLDENRVKESMEISLQIRNLLRDKAKEEEEGNNAGVLAIIDDDIKFLQARKRKLRESL